MWPVIHDLTVSHGSLPVQQIDSVLIKENMSNMKRLLLGKGVVSTNLTDVPVSLGFGQNNMPTQQSRLGPTQRFFLILHENEGVTTQRYTAQMIIHHEYRPYLSLYLIPIPSGLLRYQKKKNGGMSAVPCFKWSFAECRN